MSADRPPRAAITRGNASNVTVGRASSLAIVTVAVCSVASVARPVTRSMETVTSVFISKMVSSVAFNTTVAAFWPAGMTIWSGAVKSLRSAPSVSSPSLSSTAYARRTVMAPFAVAPAGGPRGAWPPGPR